MWSYDDPEPDEIGFDFYQDLNFFIRNSIMMLRGEARWAKLVEPDTKFEPVWTINLYMDDAEKSRALEAGLKLKVDKDGDEFLQCKRKTTTKKGPNKPPTVVDSVRQPFVGNIGNGSIVNVVVGLVPYEAFGGGVSPRLEKVQVVNLVEYETLEDFDDITEEDL